MFAIIRYYAALHAHPSVPHYLKQCWAIVTKMIPQKRAPRRPLWKVLRDLGPVEIKPR